MLILGSIVAKSLIILDLGLLLIKRYSVCMEDYLLKSKLLMKLGILTDDKKFHNQV